MNLKIPTGSTLILILISVVSSTPLPKVPEHPVINTGFNQTAEDAKTYEVKLEQLSEGLVPEEFLANWLANYILQSIGMGLDETYESQVGISGENNSSMEEFLENDPVRYKSLINMDSAFGPCPRGRRRDGQGNCRKRFNG